MTRSKWFCFRLVIKNGHFICRSGEYEMEVTILTKGSEKMKVYHGVDLIRDGGNSIHIHGFYQGETFSRTWNKDDLVYIDIIAFVGGLI